jgi:hypothetical protein
MAPPIALDDLAIQLQLGRNPSQTIQVLLQTLGGV